MVELVGGNSSATYKVTGNTLNVQNDAACVVLYTIDNGETYTKLAATANEAGGYDFDLTNVPANAVIKIAIQGDFNMDGSVDALDAVMVTEQPPDCCRTTNCRVRLDTLAEATLWMDWMHC